MAHITHFLKAFLSFVVAEHRTLELCSLNLEFSTSQALDAGLRHQVPGSISMEDIAAKPDSKREVILSSKR